MSELHSYNKRFHANITLANILLKIPNELQEDFIEIVNNSAIEFFHQLTRSLSFNKQTVSIHS